MTYTPLRKSRPKSTKAASWLTDYFKANPIKCISAWLTSAGLFIIFAYHSHIEYTSKFDMKSFASLVFLAAYTEFSVLIASSLLLFLPVGIIGMYVSSQEQNARKMTATIIAWFCFSWLAFLALCAFVFAATAYH
jgi:hypothetical protein